MNAGLVHRLLSALIYYYLVDVVIAISGISLGEIRSFIVPDV